MNESMRDLLREGAETVERPDLDVGHLVAQAEGRLRRRRFAAVGAAALAVGVITAGGLALTPGDQKLTPVPPANTVTPPPPAGDGSIYFAADSMAGPSLTAPLNLGKVETDPQDMDIYLSRRGEPVRRIIGTNAHERCPVVSPDSSRLAYLEGTTIVVVPLDYDGSAGTPAVRLDLSRHGLLRPHEYRPDLSAGPACPRWSPDGRRLGYLVITGDPSRPQQSLYDPVTAEVHAVSLDGTDRVLAAFDVMYWDTPTFAWAPDSDAIAYTTLDGVWRAPLVGGAAELIWRTEEIDLSQKNPVDGDRPISLTWSSRNELALTLRGFAPSEPNNPMSGGNETFRLLVLDADSGRIRLQAEAGSSLESGAAESFSADGSQLVFTGADGRILLNSRDTNSTRPLHLAVDGSEEVYAPSWSPDGQTLLVRARSDARGFALVSFSLDGSSSEVRTPWSWALDWASLDDVEWVSSGLGEG